VEPDLKELLHHRANDMRLPLQEQAMPDGRYYIVGENDVWMLQFRETEHRDVTRRNAAVAFAVGAAQELGMRGE